MKRFAVKIRRILEEFRLKVLQKKLWAQCLDLCMQQWSGLLWSSNAFWKFSLGSWKKFWAYFLDFSSRNEAVCREVQTHFESPLPARFTEKILGADPRFVCSKTKLFSVNFRCILEVLAVWGLWKKFRAHYHDLCVQKWNCLPWSSDAFQKFSASKVCRESSGQIFTIDVSKNEAVCCEVHTHFGSYLPASFAEKDVGAISQFVPPKTKLYAV